MGVAASVGRLAGGVVDELLSKLVLGLTADVGAASLRAVGADVMGMGVAGADIGAVGADVTGTGAAGVGSTGIGAAADSVGSSSLLASVPEEVSPGMASASSSGANSGILLRGLVCS